MDVITIAALFDDSDAERAAGYRNALAEADVVLGIDVSTQREFTVFGTPALEETIRLPSEQALRTLRVELSEPNSDLDKLTALVRILKGHSGHLLGERARPGA